MAIKLYRVYKTGHITLTRKVAKSGDVYIITLPKEIGKALHRKLVLVEITALEEDSPP